MGPELQNDTLGDIQVAWEPARLYFAAPSAYVITDLGIPPKPGSLFPAVLPAVGRPTLPTPILSTCGVSAPTGASSRS